MCPPCMVTVQFYPAVFRFHLPSLSSDPVLRILLRSFQLSSAECVLRPHTWDFSMVLTYLVSPAFEPLSQASFRALPLTTLFLMALATAKMSWGATGSLFHSHLCGWGCLPSYIPQFVAKSESLTRFFPRSFLVTSLADFAAGLDSDLLLCPVRALHLYLLRARSSSPGRHRLFVSPRRPARPFLRTRCRSFFLGGGGHSCCSGGWTSGWIPPGSRSPQRVHLCRVPPSLVGYLCP